MNPDNAAENSLDWANFEFPFPYTPYLVQRAVMRCIAESVSSGGALVVESPTGTGKSQMLLNGVLSARHDLLTLRGSCQGNAALFEARRLNELEWARQLDVRGNNVTRNLFRRRRGPQDRSGAAASALNRRAAIPDLIDQPAEESDSRGIVLSSSSSDSTSSADDSDTDSDAATCVELSRRCRTYFASRTHTQLVQLSEELRRSPLVVPRPAASTLSSSTRAGRKHVRETIASVAVSSRSEASTDGSLLPEFGPAAFVHLASRMQYCINTSLREQSCGSGERLNELCKDAVASATCTKAGKKAVRHFWQTRGHAAATAQSLVPVVDVEDLGRGVAAGAPCPFAEASRVRVLKDYMRCNSRTMVELIALGKELGACPFLAAKEMIVESDVVFLPYHYLLDRNARESLIPLSLWRSGVTELPAAAQHRPPARLESGSVGNVVVFDEAHHVADVARRCSSASVSVVELVVFVDLVRAYLERFDRQLLARSKSRLRELSSFVTKLASYVASIASAPPQPQEAHQHPEAPRTLVEDVSGLSFRAGVDHINVAQLVAFLGDSRLAFKLPSRASSAVLSAVSAATGGSHSTAAAIGPAMEAAATWRSICGDLYPFVACLGSENATVGAERAPDRTPVGMQAQVASLKQKLLRAATNASQAVERFLSVFASELSTDAVAVVRCASDVPHPPLVTQDVATDAGINSFASTPSLPLRSDVVSTASLTLLSLTGGLAFRDVWSAASSVVFAGGTMKPLEMSIDPLLSCVELQDQTGAMPPTASGDGGDGLAKRGYRVESFPHVVPAASLRVCTLGVGPAGVSLDFGFTHRSKDRRVLCAMFDEVGRTLLALARIVPGGMIVCFTSYAMEAAFFEHISEASSQSPESLFSQLNRVKRTFRERGRGRVASSTHPRGVDGPAEQHRHAAANDGLGSDDVEVLLREYRAHVEQSGAHGGGGGAILSCVMGGKLTEGINFADDLGRCVVAVGVPFGQPHDVETRLLLCAATGVTSFASSTGCNGQQGEEAPSVLATANMTRAQRELYQGLAMRTVNQSIGRCIRHAKDFAAVVLLDARYKQAGLSRKVAQWMQPSMVHCGSFRDMFYEVREFFTKMHREREGLGV